MARLLRITTGFTLVIAGMFMLVLPGPGILTIIGGLALLARDLNWAKQLEMWVRRRFGTLVDGPEPDEGEPAASLTEQPEET